MQANIPPRINTTPGIMATSRLAGNGPPCKSGVNAAATNHSDPNRDSYCAENIQERPQAESQPTFAFRLFGWVGHVADD